MNYVLITYCIYFAGIAGAMKLSYICSVWKDKPLLLVWLQMVRGEGVVPMSNVNFRKYPCCLSINILDMYYFSFIEKTDDRICSICA